MTLGYTPTVAVFIPVWGLASEVWMRRQMETFTRVKPTVFCWEREPEAPEPEGYEVESLGIPWMGGERKSLGHRLSVKAGLPHTAGPLPVEEEAIKRVLYDRGFSAVLCHFAWSAARVEPIARTLKLGTLWHVHGDDVSKTLLEKAYRRHIENLLPDAHVAAVGSHQLERLHQMGLKKQNALLAPCGAPIEDFSKSPVPERHLKPIRFITVARLSPEKGVTESIRAFEIAQQTLHNAEFFVIGDGPQRREIEKLAKQVGGVTLLGKQAPSRIAEELAHAHVFLQHSIAHEGKEEGFGVTIVEAAASGVPTIASRIGGIPDQIMHQRNGLLFEPGDVQQQADMMRELARDEERRLRMGREARELAPRFEVSAQTRKIEDKLLQLAGVSALGVIR
ncbi:MAG: glycosyltransferase family 4 protein [Planctomycetota bacterium]